MIPKIMINAAPTTSQTLKRAGQTRASAIVTSAAPEMPFMAPQ
jgi:hypothetical protein